jgi:hypothetical protein
MERGRLEALREAYRRSIWSRRGSDCTAVRVSAETSRPTVMSSAGLIVNCLLGLLAGFRLR